MSKYIFIILNYVGRITLGQDYDVTRGRLLLMCSCCFFFLISLWFGGSGWLDKLLLTWLFFIQLNDKKAFRWYVIKAVLQYGKQKTMFLKAVSNWRSLKLSNLWTSEITYFRFSINNWYNITVLQIASFHSKHDRERSHHL